MLKKLLSVAICAFALWPAAHAQRNCGSMEHLNHLLEENPDLHKKMDAHEHRIQNILDAQKKGQLANGLSAATTVTIPVVVHVVYNNSTENISTAQINSQINVLNADFSASNGDISSVPSLFTSRIGDANIQFALATTDPSGNPTSGITRTPTTRTSFSTSGNPVKFNSTGGKDAWPTDQYLNIWVCDISGGILGYAQFPNSGSAATDGVVTDFAYFGTTGTATAPFNLGRTTTHEVGHWLNLRHIWGDTGCGGDDFVSDTPLAGSPNFGCPSFGANSCSGGDPDMWMNYMDYVDDRCMYMFSQGQVNRMRATFETGGGRESFNPTTVTPPPPPTGTPTYCASRGNSTADEWIQRFRYAGIDNNSGNNGGYADFTSISTNVSAGTGYTLTVNPGWSGRVFPEGYAIWIDRNQDGDFSDSGERIGATGSAITASSVSGTLTVPANSNNGTTRLRVSMKYNGVPTECEVFSFGEVEDYTLNISNGIRQARDISLGGDLGLEVYPNPTSSNATVRFEVAGEPADVVLSVTDVRGVQVASRTWSNVNGTIEYKLNSESLGQGVYLVAIESNGAKQVKRLMVTEVL